MSLNTI